LSDQANHSSRGTSLFAQTVRALGVWWLNVPRFHLVQLGKVDQLHVSQVTGRGVWFVAIGGALGALSDI